MSQATTPTGGVTMKLPTLLAQGHLEIGDFFCGNILGSGNQPNRSSDQYKPKIAIAHPATCVRNLTSEVSSEEKALMPPKIIIPNAIDQ